MVRLQTARQCDQNEDITCICRSSAIVEIPLHIQYSGCLHHVEANHGIVVHDNRMIGLDEAHATCKEVDEGYAKMFLNLKTMIMDWQTNSETHTLPKTRF